MTRAELASWRSFLDDFFGPSWRIRVARSPMLFPAMFREIAQSVQEEEAELEAFIRENCHEDRKGMLSKLIPGWRP